jgi:hypothetical protein
MPTLSSLLVQREIASMRAVEDAISRQVLHGGDFPTNLLELGAVNEHSLVWALAESLGIEPAPVGKLPAPDVSVLRMIPGELALRHGIFPLAVEGRALVVATSEALSPAVEEDIGYSLAMAVRPRAAPLVRIREALAAHYAIPLDRRFARLLAKLDGRPDPSPSSRPPPPRAERMSAFPAPEPPPFGAIGTGAVGIPAAPLGELPPLDAGPSSARAPSAGLEPIGAEVAPAAGPPPERPSTPPSSPRPAGAHGGAELASFLHRVADERRGAPASRPRRKGPFTAAMAEHELEQATTTEAVLDVFFDFAHQFFEYAALFVVHGELAEGRDAAGPGADRTKVTAIGVPLDVPSSFSAARERRGPVVAPLSEGGLDVELARDLGRASAISAPRPAPVAILPLLVRTRVVALLYGDDGATGIELGALGELIAFAGLGATALERVILLKKRGARARESFPPPPMAAHPRPPKARPDTHAGAAALVRALGAPATASTPPPPAPAPAAALPMPQVSPGASSVFPPERPSAPPPARGTRRTSVPPPHDADRLDGGWTSSERRSDDSATRPEVPRAKRGEDVALPFEATQTAPAGVEPAGATAAGPPPEPAARPSSPPRSDLREKSTIPGHRAAMAGLVGRIIEVEAAPSSAVGPAPSASAGPPGTDATALVARLLEGGPGRDEALRAIEADPEHALPALDEVFPGPLDVDRHRVRDQLPRPSLCGPVLRALVALGAAALPLLARRCTDPDPEKRFWAAHALGELTVPGAASALLQRLFDEDVSVRRVARRAATLLLQARGAGSPLAEGLDRLGRDGAEPTSRRVLAIDTMGDMRAAAVVPGLISVLGDASDEVSEAARRALSLVTRQDFGRDAGKWREWWDANAGRHRVEWLIDALMHELPSMRRAAGDELKQLTREYFGYYDDLPKKERERAQTRYRDWWQREGRARFRG